MGKQTFMQWLRVAASIRKRLRSSYIVILVVMLIPVLVSLWAMRDYAARYHHVISQVDQVAALKPVVTDSIPDELFSIVAGRSSFDTSPVYRYIDETNASLDKLMTNQPTSASIELSVARRTMNTLSDYVDQMAEQWAERKPVAENEALLEEVRGVATLIGDMLQEYNAKEIAQASSTSQALQQTVRMLTFAEIALLLVAVAFTMLAHHSLSTAIHVPLANLESFAEDIAAGNLHARVPNTSTEELVSLSHSLNTMAIKLQDLIDENKREQENLKKSELRTLQAQIAPHFLYNTLDAIVWLAEEKRSEEVIQITKAMSDFFRISLSQGRDWIPLADEVKHLQGYLTIQKTRYRDILDYEINIPASLYEYEVLKLIIQPLVENAIYHGIKHRRGRGLVSITVEEQGGYLHCHVRDNGAGMTPERLEAVRAQLLSTAPPAQGEAGYGLYNVNQRIKLYYAQKDGIHIESSSEGTEVSFKVPVRK